MSIFLPKLATTERRELEITAMLQEQGPTSREFFVAVTTIHSECRAAFVPLGFGRPIKTAGSVYFLIFLSVVNSFLTAVIFADYSSL